MKKKEEVWLKDEVDFGVWDGLREKNMEKGKDFGVVGFEDVIEEKKDVKEMKKVDVDKKGLGESEEKILMKKIN